MVSLHSKILEYEGISEYRLQQNNLKILLSEQRAAPVVALMVVYRVGSRNEAVGYTGATHLLEHMLFKGTPTYNKKNGTQIAAVLQKHGAIFNADTWLDRTRYFEMLPSDQLELAIHLEADRMRNSFIADEDRQLEMTVVRNELERGENDPGRILDERVWAMAFREHPYHHPTIGWRSDVEGIPTTRLKEFYDTYYHPDNATVIVVGDFATEDALELIEKHFGGIPPAAHPIPPMYTVEPPQQGEIRFVLRRVGQLGIVQMAWHVPEATHPDSGALAVLDLPGDAVGHVGLVCFGVELLADLVALGRAWVGWSQVDADVHIVLGGWVVFEICDVGVASCRGWSACSAWRWLPW